MADEQDVIRIWLETNFAEALGKGEAAVEDFRSSVKTMGPEVERVFTTIDRKTVPAVENLEKAAKPAVKSFADISRGAFMAERAIGALATGQGIARTGPMLEGLIGLIGGPAGMGFMIGSMALAAEKYIPMLIKHFDLMGSKTDETFKKLEQLAAGYRKAVESMESKAPPGTEHQQKSQKSRLDELFNMRTLKGPGGIESALLSAGLAHDVSDMKREEIDELSEAEKVAKFRRDQFAAQEKGRKEPGGGEIPITMTQEQVTAANDAVAAIEQRVASRTRDKLLSEAANPNTPEGKKALNTLAHMADKHPRLFPSGFSKRIREILQGAPPEANPQSKGEMEREYQDLAKQWDKTGQIRGRQAIERRMRELEIEMHPETFGKSDPRTLGKGSPVDQIMHPELYGHTRGWLPRERRAPYAHLVPQPGLGPPIGPPHITSPQQAHAMERFHEKPEHRAERMQEDREHAMSIPGVRKNLELLHQTPQQRASRQYDQLQAVIKNLVEKQALALQLEQAHIASHEKTQHVVAGLQHMLNPLLARVKKLDADAKGMLAGQQRTQQNAGGN